MFRFGTRATGALFLFGLLLGGALSAPSPTSSVTVYTRSVSCAGLDFYPADNVTEYSNVGALRYGVGANDSGTFRCDPGLPTGAVVTKVQFTLFDHSNVAEVKACRLRRSGLSVARAAPVIQTMAGPLNTGPLYNAGPLRLSTTAISYATIDNAAFGYWLECTIFLNSPILPRDIAGIYGADVIYTITAAKG